nr:uncharacterized protein LOC116775792 [Danaus plexippus plexippus]
MGEISDLFGTNQHYNIPSNYQDFGRRFVPQYLYTKKKSLDELAEEKLHDDVQQFIEDREKDKEIVPVKAPPEFVLKIAKTSAILEKSKPVNPSDEFIQKDILRSGNYWNDVWVEEVNPKKLLRTSHSNQPESVKVEIMPGSKLYSLVSLLKEKSPRLLYVINKSD